MVSNHSLKQQARELAEKLKINYTQALEIVKNREAFNLLDRISEQQKSIAKEAAKIVRDGFDVIVYGATGSGKTTMLHAIMEELEGTPRVLVQRVLEPGLKTDDPSYEVVTNRQFDDEDMRKHWSKAREFYETKDVAALDELHEFDDYEPIVYFEHKPLIAAVHGSTTEHALTKVNRMRTNNDRNWDHSYFVHCSRDSISGARFAAIYESIEAEKKSKKGFENYTEELKAMASSLLHILEDFKPLTISEALQKSADYHRTTPSMMKYALSYAHTKRYVEIDYDEGTVIRLP